MRVIGEGVEEQIRVTMTGQMVRQRLWRGKDQTLGRDAALLCFSAQIGRHDSMIGIQPKDTPWHRAQEPHPNVKHGWRDFVAVVEAAENKTFYRQAARG